MMISYQKIKNKSRIVQSLTGLTRVEFETLLLSFETIWRINIENTLPDGKKRKRAWGAGKKSQLRTIEDKLLFILFYFRVYPTQELQGFLFNLSQPQGCDWIHRLTPILNQALGKQQQLPERRPENLKQVLERCPVLEFIIDGTERSIARPKDKEKQKSNYSGKKKRHTVKNNLITDRQGKILFLSKTAEGKKHDKKLADEENYQFPEGSKLWKDTGYQGYEPEGVMTFQPKKKPRGGELTELEKEKNKEIAKERIEIEHNISSVKRCKIVHDIFRNRKDLFEDVVMETACGLHNFRTSQRSQKVA
jgi:hypothetical protein